MSEKPFKILVKYTTRGRVDRFFDGMESIYRNCAKPEYLRVLVTADEDDSQMNCDFVKNKLLSYKNCEIIYGISTGKVNAINRDFEYFPEYDVLVNFSDDMRMTFWGWDECIRADFSKLDLSYYVAYLDVDTKGLLSTMLIAGKDWINMFGFVYDPKFHSLYCDNLVEDCSKHLGKFHYTGYTIYQHLLPSYGHLEGDEMWEKQQKIGYSVDSVTYNQIKAKGIPEYLKQFNL